MWRGFAFGAPAGSAGQCACSLACIAFVVALAVAFWAGAVWLGQALIHVATFGF
jgi:hypothetical protein